MTKNASLLGRKVFMLTRKRFEVNLINECVEYYEQDLENERLVEEEAARQSALTLLISIYT